MAAANTTLMKQSLRNNNRALARALELKKAELQGAQQDILQLQAERQAMVEQLSKLQKVAGLRDTDIENEVDERMEVP